MESASDKLNITVAKNNNLEVNGTNIRLELIEGYEDLSDRQQRYLLEYASDPENKTLAAMKLGYTTREINQWFEQETFSEVAGTIYDIYTEVLKSVDFRDSIDNSKIRNRVIKSRERGGKYTEDNKTVNNNLITDSSLKDVLKMLSD